MRAGRSRGRVGDARPGIRDAAFRDAPFQEQAKVGSVLGGQGLRRRMEIMSSRLSACANDKFKRKETSSE